MVDAPDRQGSATNKGWPRKQRNSTTNQQLTESLGTSSNLRHCQLIDGYTGSQCDCGLVVSDTRLLDGQGVGRIRDRDGNRRKEQEGRTRE